MTTTKGFTLIELIIVIALIALLATTVILVINPAKLFAEARDAQRIADLGQMNSALSLTIARSGTAPTLGSCSTLCYVQPTGLSANCGGRYTGKTTTQNSSQKVDGTGWVPVSLAVSGESPVISAWPIDPKNNTTYFYAYACSTANEWEFSSKMESARYSNTGTDDVESTDGGSSATLFEVGSNVNGI